MSELTPEEKQRIYEEERVCAEARTYYERQRPAHGTPQTASNNAGANPIHGCFGILIFLFIVYAASGSCNHTSTDISANTPTSPSIVATPTVKAESKTDRTSKVVKTPEAECDELISKLKETGDWSMSGMSENGTQRVVQDVYVGDNGVLQIGLCDWFWQLGTTQMRQWLEQLQKIWASVYSPSAPCKAKLSCWVPDHKNENGIPIKVDCKGISEERAQKLSDETRGNVSPKTLQRYQDEQFAELQNRSNHRR